VVIFFFFWLDMSDRVLKGCLKTCGRVVVAHCGSVFTTSVLVEFKGVRVRLSDVPHVLRGSLVSVDVREFEGSGGAGDVVAATFSGGVLRFKAPVNALSRPVEVHYVDRGAQRCAVYPRDFWHTGQVVCDESVVLSGWIGGYVRSSGRGNERTLLALCDILVGQGGGLPDAYELDARDVAAALRLMHEILSRNTVNFYGPTVCFLGLVAWATMQQYPRDVGLQAQLNHVWRHLLEQVCFCVLDVLRKASVSALVQLCECFGLPRHRVGTPDDAARQATLAAGRASASDVVLDFDVFSVLASTVWARLVACEWSVARGGRLYVLASQLRVYAQNLFLGGVGYATVSRGGTVVHASTALGTLMYARVARLQRLRDCDDASRLCMMLQLHGIDGLWARVPAINMRVSSSVHACLAQLVQHLQLEGTFELMCRGDLNIVKFPQNKLCVGGGGCAGKHRTPGKLYGVCNTTSAGDVVVVLKSFSSQHVGQRLLTVRFPGNGGQMCLYYA